MTEPPLNKEETGYGGLATSLYKVTAENGEPYHGGSGAWGLPKGNRPGKWRSVDGDLRPCRNGLHLSRKSDILEWLGPVIWEAEYDGEIIEQPDKVVVRKARLLRRVDNWNDQTARLFAADCAERVLHIANNQRCDAAVLAARRYAFGLIDGAARGVGYGTRAAMYAWAAAKYAWDAARYDAMDAARTARAAERQWQQDRLLQYLNGEVDLEAIRAVVLTERKPE